MGHRVLPTDGRVALTLRLLGGLTTERSCALFLLTASTITQRVVRAKRMLTGAKVPFEVPRADECGARPVSVFEAICLVFNEGYSATAGVDWMRPAHDTLSTEPLLANYHWLPSVRGDLLARLGRVDGARAEFERAAGMTRNLRDREFLLARAVDPAPC